MSDQGLPYRLDKDALILTVRVTPKSSKDAVERIETDAAGQTFLKVRVRAVPENGAANKAVCQLLAKWLGLSKSAVSVQSGETSRVKHLKVEAPEGQLVEALLSL